MSSIKRITINIDTKLNNNNDNKNNISKYILKIRIISQKYTYLKFI